MFGNRNKSSRIGGKYGKIMRHSAKRMRRMNKRIGRARIAMTFMGKC